MAKIYVLHENDEWVMPLRSAFEALRLPYEEWFLDEGVVDTTRPPPDGVFYNRIEHENHARYEQVLADHDIEIAACEMIVDAEGRAWTYDLNTNTNYNSGAETAAGYAGTTRAGMMGVARFLGDALETRSRPQNTSTRE